VQSRTDKNAVAQTLLLADDSVTIQRVIELTFAEENIKVVAVSDGDEAISRIDADPPDIVLADVGMPGRSGYEVAEHVKRAPGLKHIPVLLLTGAFEPIDRDKAVEVGCDGVLAKPFEPQLVISRVRELLGLGERPDARRDAAAEPAVVAHAASGSSESAGEGWTRQASVPVEAGRSPDIAKLDNYFEQLDAAFATLTDGRPPESPRTEPAAPLEETIDWFGAADDAPQATPPPSEPAPTAPVETENLPAPAPESKPFEMSTLEIAGFHVPEADMPTVEVPADMPGPGPSRFDMPAPEISAPGMSPSEIEARELAAFEHGVSDLAMFERPASEAASFKPAPPEAVSYEPPPPDLSSFEPSAHAPAASAWPAATLAEPVRPPSTMARAEAPRRAALPPLADAFAAILAAEQNEGVPAADLAWPEPPMASPAGSALAEADINAVARRVLEQLSDSVVRETVADLVSRVAERLVREEIERIKSSIEPGS
jgi:CheY-like chemotaxis protein